MELLSVLGSPCSVAVVPHVNPAAFSSSSIVMTKSCPPSFFQDEADVLLFCCLVESGVGDGLGPVHFQYLA